MNDIKTIKDVSKYMLSDLTEGLLAGMDSAFAEADKYVDEETFKPWMMNDKCKMTKKKNGYVLRGNFKTKDIKDTYYGPKIVAVYGNFSVSDTKLSDLTGLFSDDCIIEGTFTIENNDNLVSLKGCPISVSTLVVANNKSLMDIDIAPNVMVNAYISKNGKKFKEEKLRGKMNVYKKIFCSVENEEDLVNESMINEAFKAPQLKLVADAIKDSSKDVKRENRFHFDNLKNIAWDKIEASQISEYDSTDSKYMTHARGFVYKKAYGMYILMKNDQVYAIILGKTLMQFKSITNYGTTTYRKEKYSSGSQLSNQDILDWIESADSFMFVDLKDMDNTYDLQQSRRAARSGAIAMDRGYERTGKPTSAWSRADIIDAKQVRYYQDIADQNRRRYKELATQIKAKKALNNGSFINIKNRLDKVFARYTALLSKIYANPEKYSRWDIEWLNDKFFNYSSSKYSTSESGLFKSIEDYMRFLIEASKGDVYMGNSGMSIQDKMKDYEAKIVRDIDMVEVKINEIETIK